MAETVPDGCVPTHNPATSPVDVSGDQPCRNPRRAEGVVPDMCPTSTLVRFPRDFSHQME
jgi:hypothetical protein